MSSRPEGGRRAEADGPFASTERASPGLRALGSAGALIALAALFFAFAWLLVAALLKPVAGLVVGHLDELLVLLLFSPRTVALFLLGGLAAVVVLLWSRGRGLSSGWAPLVPRAALLSTLLFLALLVRVALSSSAPEANAFGYVGASDPNSDRHFTHWVDPSLPAMHVVTNEHGYRDEPWRETGTSRRVLLVGDSMVWGACLPEHHDMLDHHLEAELRRRAPGSDWEVLNAGLTPSGLPYYLDALERVGDAAEAEILVMSHLAGVDAYPLDVPTLVQRSGTTLASYLRSFGVLEELMHFNSRIDYSEESLRSRLLARAHRRHVVERWARFVAGLEQRARPLIVWEPMGREPLFDAYRGHALLGFVSSEDLPPPTRRSPTSPGSPRTKAEWWRDTPGYFVEGDGHPTGLANQRFAGAIASAILRALDGPTRAPPPSTDNEAGGEAR